jgi:hypothetical protein
MTEPARYDLKIYQGITFKRQFTWKDENSVVYDLSTFTAHMQIRTATLAPTPVINLTTGSGITLSSTSPNITLLLTSDQTTALPLGEDVYDLTLTDTNSVVTLLLKGKASINPTVTR